jgi:dTDP-4-amino-4,6-dideoxygalactose transaminase
MSDWRVPLTTLSLPESDIAAVLETLESGWLTMGPRTIELEQAFAKWAGAEHAVAVSSGTAALHLACLAAGVGPGDKAIAPALSFVADAHAPRCCGAETALADSRSFEDPTIDPDAVAALLTPQTKALIAVHMFGYTADLEALQALCDEGGVVLIEDCCEAAGASLPDGSRAGTAGLAGCFSFFSKTQLGVGEGGIVITDNEQLAERLRLLRTHAMTVGTWDRHRGHAETYDVTDLGYNFRIDEPRATLAKSRLARLDDAVGELRRVAEAYRAGLADLEGLEIPFSDEAVERSGHFAFPVLVSDLETRDAVRTHLHANGVQTTFYPALTQLTEYTPAQGDSGCPVAEEFADRHLALPLSPSLDEEKIQIVIAAAYAALAGAR